jgi:hypothetical protein
MPAAEQVPCVRQVLLGSGCQDCAYVRGEQVKGEVDMGELFIHIVTKYFRIIDWEVWKPGGNSHVEDLHVVGECC